MIRCLALCLCSSIVVAPLPTQDSGQLPFTVDDVLDVARVRAGPLSDDGRFVVVTSATLRDRIGTDTRRYGDPTYRRPSRAMVSVVDTQTGESQPLFRHRVQVRNPSWSRDGRRLALLVQSGDGTELRVWDRETGSSKTLTPPTGHVIASDASALWLANDHRLVVALRTADWAPRARAQFLALTEGPIVVHSSERPFLEWEELRRTSLRRSLWTCEVATGAFEPLVAEADIRSYAISRNGQLLRYAEDRTEKTDYDETFGSDNRVVLLPLDGGEARTAIESTRKRRAVWAADFSSYTYAEKGDLFFAKADGSEPRRLTGEPKKDDAPEPEKTGEPETKDERETFRPVRLSGDGRQLIATSAKGIYLVDTSSGERTRFLDTPEKDETAPRRAVVGWSDDARYVYLSHASRTEYERGFLRYDTRSAKLEELVKDGHIYGGFTLSRNGATIVFRRASGNRPDDLYAAAADLSAVRRLTDANTFLAERKLSDTELVDYLDVDGNRLYGVLYFPADYEKGRRYPTVFVVYESFFDDSFNATINYLTSNGYAVMRPSVKLERGYPGEAWLKGVTAAANRLIERGIADPKRLGVHGTSYGGYAVNLLVTQTDRFAAAINISGKVNMISFYTDSPRLGVRNIHAPEKSQDRIGATLWEQPQKYLAHSAILDADRIDTPLLLITGDQDHNVPGRQAMEMYYALRRLGKRVEWVRYVDGGHGTPTSTVDEVFDYHRRILGWYGRYLKVDAAEDTGVGSNGGR